MTDWSETARTSPVSRPRGDTFTARAMDRDGFLRKLDWVLVGAVGLLCILGVALVWAAAKPQGTSSSYSKKDVLNIVLGLILAVVAASVDYRTLRAYTPVLYVASILGLLVVLSPLGSRINGAHSWISLGGGFEIQPSEFAKIAIILGMAMLLSERREGISEPTTQDVVYCLALSAVPAVLILAQPDVGTIMVFGFIIFGMLSLSGIPARWIVGMLLFAILGSLAIAHLHLLSTYQVDRLRSFTHPGSGSQSYGLNQHESITAIGHGGLWGQGLGHGALTNGNFVPEQPTDFVFSVAGEELGLVGSAIIVALSGIVLWRGLRIARLAEDSFGMLVAVGIVCWFGFQIFENVGMNIGIMPITGLPLPFVSYGGTSMFASMLAIGLLQNVHIRTAR